MTSTSKLPAPATTDFHRDQQRREGSAGEICVEIKLRIAAGETEGTAGLNCLLAGADQGRWITTRSGLAAKIGIDVYVVKTADS